MLDVDAVHTYYDDSHILNGVSIHVPKGKVVSILGRNGVGKTTLVRSITGLTPPKCGRIVLEGRDITRLTPNEIARLGVGLVPQGRRLFPSLTVRETLEIVERRGQGPWNVDRVFELFPRLAQRARNRGCELSGGEQQMLAIGRALVTNPKIFLLDEPTEGLAPLVVKEVGRTLKRIKEDGYSILLVEQRMLFALDIADEVYIMSKGQVVYKGAPSDIASNAEVKQKYLGV